MARPSKMSLCLSPSTCATTPTLTPSEPTTFQPCSICNHETGSVMLATLAPRGSSTMSSCRLVVETDRGNGLGQRLSSLAGHDRRAHGEEFDHVRTPTVRAFLQLHADDAFGLELFALLLHPFHRELPRVVKGLREVGHLDVLARLLHCREHPLVRNVVDTRAHHESNGPVS